MVAKTLVGAVAGALVLALSAGGGAVAATSAPGSGVQIEQLPIDIAGDVWAWPSDAQAWPARLMPAIHVFGQDYGGKVESSLMFDMLRVGTKVTAAYPGVVVRITKQPDTCDAEVYIENPSGTSTLHGSYDHISPTVKVGQQVATGQVIGTVPKWQCNQAHGGVELMLVEQTAKDVVAVCPMSVLAPQRAAAIRKLVVATMRRWNAAPAGYASQYDTATIARGDICKTRTASAH